MSAASGRGRAAHAPSELLAARPCVSCPYRRDVPSGIWDAAEYEKLPKFDLSIAEQAMAGETSVFYCHQNDGKLCAGWIGCHGTQTLGIRLKRDLTEEDARAIMNYETDVPLFASGAEACEHGKREIEHPIPAALKMIDTLIKKQRRRR